jgi:hypothetical protein
MTDCPLGAEAALVEGLGLRSKRPPDFWANANKGDIARRRAAVFAILIQNPTLRTRIPTLALCRFGVRLTIEKTLNFPIQPFFCKLNGPPQIKPGLIDGSVRLYGGH